MWKEGKYVKKGARKRNRIKDGRWERESGSEVIGGGGMGARQKQRE